MQKNPIISAILLLFLLPACRQASPRTQYKVLAAVHHFRNVAMPDSMIVSLPDTTTLSIATLYRINVGADTTKENQTLNLFAIQRDDEKIYYSYSIPNGSIQRLTWSDGTSIALDAGSTIEFTDKDSQQQRKYYLIGRAIVHPIGHLNDTFSITSSKGSVIHSYTDSLYIDCYNDRKNEIIGTTGGTTFVEAYGVELRMDSEAGVQFNPEGMDELKNFNVPTAQNWCRSIRFYGFTPSEIAADFSRWYNRSIVADPNDSTKIFTGIFPRDLRLDSACYELEQMFGLKLKAR